VLERDLTGVIHFSICIKWYQRFDNFLMMARDSDELQGLLARMATVEGRLDTLESVIDNLI